MGSYMKWLIGLVLGALSSLIINMATDYIYINSGEVTTHDIRKRDTQTQGDDTFEQIMAKLNESDWWTAAEIYEKLPDIDRKSILPAIVKQYYSYSGDNVDNILNLALIMIQSSRMTDDLSVVQLLLQEMKSQKYLDQIQFLSVDCFLSSPKLNTLIGSSNKIVEEIKNELRDPVAKVRNTLVEQINQPNPKNDLLQLHRGDGTCISFLCPEQFIKVVQRAFKANDSVIKNISDFSARLKNTSCAFVESAGNVLLELYRLIKKSGHTIDKYKLELIEVVRQILIFDLDFWVPYEKTHLTDFKNIEEKLGHNFDEDNLNMTIRQIQGGKTYVAWITYNRISYIDHSKLINRPFSKQYIDNLIDFAEFDSESMIETLLDQVIDHGDGHNPAIFLLADKIDNNSEASQKITRFAITMVLPIRENNFTMMPLLQYASEYYIGKIVEAVYEPSEDTELNLITFAEKLIKEDRNAEGSVKAYSQLYTEMERQDHMKFRSRMAMARGLNEFREYTLHADLMEKIYNMWVSKIPWDINNIVTEKYLCIINYEYQSDHLLLRGSGFYAIVMSAASHNDVGLKWQFLGDVNGTHYALSSEKQVNLLVGKDDMMLCTSGKRKIGLFGYKDGYPWEIHDYDWKKNLYMIYNNVYKEYLYSDDQLRLSPPAGRHVYLAKKQDPISTASVWRFSQC